MTAGRYPTSVSQAVAAPVVGGVMNLTFRAIRSAYRATWSAGQAAALWYLGAWPRLLQRQPKPRPSLRGRAARRHRAARADRIALAQTHAQLDAQEASRRVRRPRRP